MKVVRPMPYRKTDNVTRKLAARHGAILAAANAIAAESGMSAVQILSVAERAGIAAGTVYRYFPSKTELVGALVSEREGEEVAALRAAAAAAPGPLSALTAAVTCLSTRALARRRLAFALIAEPVEPEIDAVRAAYRRRIADELRRLIADAIGAGHLPLQDAPLAAAALVGALAESLLGPLAVPAVDSGTAREQAQGLALLALRALGVPDARARGLVAQALAAESVLR